MTRLEIQCIRKTNRFEAHDRIHSIGGVDGDGGRWRLSQQDAVKAIERGSHTFFISHGQAPIEVVTAVSRYGYRYLKTVADDVQPDELLDLPDCP